MRRNGLEESKLRVDGLSVGIIKDLAFELRSGEVTGITRLVGSGFDGIGSLLFGERQASVGEVHLGSEQIAMSQMTAAKVAGLGIGFIPCGRHSQGCITQLTVTDNLAMPALRTFTKRESLRWGPLHRHVRDWVARLAVVPPQPAKVLEELSGGDQQKVLVATCLQLSPRLLIAVEPTQGVDVGARAKILRLLRDSAASDAGIVWGVDAGLVSQELEVKVLGVLRLLEALRDRLGPGSTVIVIGGNLAFELVANGGGLGAAQAALSNLFRQMCKASIDGHGPCFYVIAPGPVRAPRLDAMLPAARSDAHATQLRIIEPEQMALMIDVLVDEQSRAMTGGTMVMDCCSMRMGLL